MGVKYGAQSLLMTTPQLKFPITAFVRIYLEFPEIVVIWHLERSLVDFL